jgi:hypothetical protein
MLHATATTERRGEKGGWVRVGGRDAWGVGQKRQQGRGMSKTAVVKMLI